MTQYRRPVPGAADIGGRYTLFAPPLGSSATALTGDTIWHGGERDLKERRFRHSFLKWHAISGCPMGRTPSPAPHPLARRMTPGA